MMSTRILIAIGFSIVWPCDRRVISKCLSKELMMRSLFIFLLVTVFYVCFSSLSQSATLEEVVEYTLRQNPDLRSLRLEEEIARAQLQKARLPLIANPTVESNIVAKGKGGDVQRTFTDYGVGLSQEFEIAGQRGFRIDVAEKEIQRVGLEIRDKERIITSEVRNAFARTLASKRKVELRKDSVRLKEELLELTRIKLKAGDVSGLEVNVAELEYGKTKTELLLSEREYKESILDLQNVMGASPDVNAGIEGQLPTDNLRLPDKEDLRKSVRANRADLKASAVEAERTQSAIKLATREATPNITVRAFYQRDELRNTGGLIFSIPLPLIDTRQAERKIAKIRSEQSMIRYPNLQRMIEKEVEEGYVNLALSREEIALYSKETLGKSLENLELLNVAFKEGKVGFYDVRVAQKDALDIQFSYLDAQLRAQIAINALKRITGGDLK